MILLVIGGVSGAIVGIAGIAEDEFFVVTPDWVFHRRHDVGMDTLDRRHHPVRVGIGIFTGNVLARTVGVIIAGLFAIANSAWLPHYPVWAIVAIAVDIAFIWALTAHDRDLARRAPHSQLAGARIRPLG